MSRSEPLLVFVQVSDLHIGQIDPQTGDAQISKAAAALFANLTWFDGVLGHHGRGLQDLEAFVRKLEQAGETPLLVVTGDLTRVGNPLEFDNAVNFLTTAVDLNPPFGNFVGLRSITWFSRAIPGNHDHWPGQPIIFGGPHPRFFALFPQGSLPFTRTIPLANGRVLPFMGVDTDADVSPNGHQRFRAVGSFQSQLAAAAPLVGPPREEEVRVLLMHHSWHRRGPLLSIDHGTRAALDAFLGPRHPLGPDRAHPRRRHPVVHPEPTWGQERPGVPLWHDNASGSCSLRLAVHSRRIPGPPLACEHPARPPAARRRSSNPLGGPDIRPDQYARVRPR